MFHSLPNKLYSCEQTRLLDQLAIAELGISGSVLMKRAGRAAFEFACRKWPDNRRWLVFCGGGNNGGDGYVFAALAAQRGHQVRVLTLVDPTHLRGEAAAAHKYAQQEVVSIQAFSADVFDTSEPAVLIDGLLGTGVQGPLRSELVTAIEAINASGLPVLALDLPSGLNGDTGAVLVCAVRASATITFVACKVGLLTGSGPAYTGELLFDDLALPASLYERVSSVAVNVDREALIKLLPRRAADAHKGHFGQVMVVGGDRGYGGAAIMAAEAALYAGAGKVCLATHPEHISAALTRSPEVMSVGVSSGQELAPLLTRPTVLVVGPGLGQTPWSEQLLQQALATDKPLILDADALNLLAQGRLLPPQHRQFIMTPHPGEAARLLGATVADVQSNRIAAITELQRRWGGVVVLKGVGTLIFDGTTLVVAKVGNPGLATGGSGDVLSGVMGSLLAQGLSLMDAAQLAVCLHGEAADRLVEASGMVGLLASQLPEYVRKILNS